jgi:hypothetical protein
MNDQSGKKMNKTGKVEKVCLLVQVDGKPYLVNMPQNRLVWLVALAQSLCDDGILPVEPADRCGISILDRTPDRKDGEG